MRRADKAPAGVPRDRAGSGEQAILRSLDSVVTAIPQADPTVVRGAILRVTSRTRSRSMITEHLAGHPTALVDGDSSAPAAVLAGGAVPSSDRLPDSCALLPPGRPLAPALRNHPEGSSASGAESPRYRRRHAASLGTDPGAPLLSGRGRCCRSGRPMRALIGAAPGGLLPDGALSITSEAMEQSGGRAIRLHAIPGSNLSLAAELSGRATCHTWAQRTSTDHRDHSARRAIGSV